MTPLRLAVGSMVATFVWGRERSGTGSAPTKFGGVELGEDGGLAAFLLGEEAAAGCTGRTVRNVEDVRTIRISAFRILVAVCEFFPETRNRLCHFLARSEPKGWRRSTD